MASDDFLIEIGTEELPPKSLLRLILAFEEAMAVQLEQAQLSYDSIDRFATPRRLALRINNLIAKQPDQIIKRKGPALNAAFDDQGNATKACEGFAKSNGVTVAELEQEKTDKGAWVIFHKEQKGKETQRLMPDCVQKALAKLPIAKKMRWGDKTVEFVRPVHWCVMLYGDRVVPGTLFDCESSAATRGHRFHCQDTLTITHAKDYEKILQSKGFVVADFEQRREMIQTQIIAAAKQVKGTAVITDNLLDEVTGLVEWPVALVAHFDKKFLNVPQEALISAMVSHQKSFALRDAGQNLLPCFITISNINSKDQQRVVEGNERVMRARLADAEFFYESDRKISLQEYLPRLEKIVFQKQLGSVANRCERISAMAEHIANTLQQDPALAKRAGQLSKADLVTDMVEEFPELQGTMGYYYALASNESKEVALAIRDQYSPKFAGAALPETALGDCLALALRLDLLLGIFGVNKQPTGEKDPFALRRAALGVCRILIEKQHDLDLIELLQHGVNLYHDKLINKNVIAEVYDFVIERLKAWYQEQDISVDVFAAVLARKPAKPLQFNQRVQAVKAFRELPEAHALAAANKRVSRILEKQASDVKVSQVNMSLLSDPHEKTLAQAIEQKSKSIEPLLKNNNYTAVLTELSSLGPAVDDFFDHVMVMDENIELRHNRIALLNQLRLLFLNVADISLLQEVSAECH